MDGIQYWSEEFIQHIKKQEIKIQNLEKEYQEVSKENQELKEKIDILKKKLAYYENAHTPPSARKLSEGKIQDTKKSDEMGKRGAPKGHRGATRLKPEPDEIVDVVAKECERCGSKKIQDLDEVEKNTIEDLPPLKKIKVTRFDQHKVKCLDCGHGFISKHPDCPQVGNFGIYLLVYVTILKFHLRGVLRKIQDFLFYDNNFEISTKGIHDILLRVGDVCKISYEKSIEQIRNAAWVHIDETGVKINGEKFWLWIFRTNNNEILVVIHKSRGRTVLNEILGPDWDKPIVVDGWKAYWKYRIVQRCWAHLLREIDAFKDVSDEGKQLSETIHNCFDSLKEFLEKNPSMSERVKQKTIFDNELKDIVEKYSKCKELRKPIKYLQNGLGKWYTCLLFPGMEPTNNLGEQAMREHVIMRKIIGCFRSKNGAKNYQYIASLLATWKLQDKNIFEELENLLRQELCLSSS
ncbi:MAG: IS66 family transposase [Euryarchaeota archaeon]|nr:IS66 family transposase [Euryarchaeota archaeon]